MRDTSILASLARLHLEMYVRGYVTKEYACSMASVRILQALHQQYVAEHLWLCSDLSDIRADLECVQDVNINTSIEQLTQIVEELSNG